MTGRCGSCYWWGRTAAGGRAEGDIRPCGAVPYDKGRAYQSDAEIAAGHPDDAADALAAPERTNLAMTQDDSGYFAALKSRADFGCVLHRPA